MIIINVKFLNHIEITLLYFVYVQPCHESNRAKFTAHTLAGDTAPVYDHAHGIKTMRCITLCNSCHARTLAERLGSA